MLQVSIISNSSFDPTANRPALALQSPPSRSCGNEGESQQIHGGTIGWRNKNKKETDKKSVKYALSKSSFDTSSIVNQGIQKCSRALDSKSSRKSLQIPNK